MAPASPFDRRKLARGCRVIEQMGFVPVVDKQEFSRRGFLAGDDEARARRLRRGLLEDDTRAVWCIRGGYGSSRLLERLDLERIKARPKILIGFSDITALLLPLSAPGGFVTIHGPVVTQLPDLSQGARRWLKKLISGKQPAGRVPLGRLKTLVHGRTRGFLLGGNLSVLTSLLGTPHLPPLAGAILYLEDVAELAYRLDRMLLQLRQSGAVKNVFGVLLGSLKNCRPAGCKRYSARSVLERAVTELGVPAVSGAAFGHQGRNIALPNGLLVSLDADQGRLELLEPAVC
ncbi:MAG TPA: LD-carboxypeptidase [Myxococcota bacterium]|nr:LD-carboxypeptidase [Myxococcota bacterium]